LCISAVVWPVYRIAGGVLGISTFLLGVGWVGGIGEGCGLEVGTKRVGVGGDWSGRITYGYFSVPFRAICVFMLRRAVLLA